MLYVSPDGVKSRACVGPVKHSLQAWNCAEMGRSMLRPYKFGHCIDTLFRYRGSEIPFILDDGYTRGCGSCAFLSLVCEQ
jgi:hypothetical protein